MTWSRYRAYVDESSVFHESMQEYRVCAVVVSDEQDNVVREAVRPFLLRGQVKFHWKIEPERRRQSFLSVTTNQVFYAIVVCDR
ncbi:MAG: hypothetical protein EBR52_10090, partial [Microbacteriaceae bacterium]|nr:hypothetical protein [Microbacteriaceae bacterium]